MVVGAMMTADGHVWGSRSRNSGVFRIAANIDRLLPAGGMPPQRHSTVDVEWPGGSE